MTQKFAAPTERQLAYLRDLCRRTRFPMPTRPMSRRQVATLIERLRKREAASR